MSEAIRGLVTESVNGGTRVIIGIAGIPGSGKTTFAERLVTEINTKFGSGTSSYLPMDGFHLSQDVLVSQGKHQRKGAPDTFDIEGYVSALKRVAARDETVYVPEYSRRIHEPVAASHAIGVTPNVIVTEGNYLLLEELGWESVKPALDHCVYLECDRSVARLRLIDRQVEMGATQEGARLWVGRVDTPNIDTVIETKSRADESFYADQVTPIFQ